MCDVTRAGASSGVCGLVDQQGHLISADPRLLALHLHAGGSEGGSLAIPKLATIVRLAQTLGVGVSRTLIAADRENDLELLVTAYPDGKNIALEISGWKTLAQAAARFGTPALAPADEWLWECDDALKLTGIRGYEGQHVLVGLDIAQVFRFKPDDDGDFPIIPALGQRVRFDAQRAEWREDGGDVMLSGMPVIDPQGHYHGWRGNVLVAPASSLLHAAPALDTSLAEMHGAAAQLPALAAEINTALRAPIEQIVAQADGILHQQEGSVAPHYIDYATDIAAAGRHLLGLVDDLNDAQLIEAADFRITGDAIDLADVARRAASLLRVRAADKNMRIDAPADDEILFAQGDFRRILQIMVNLIGNAVRYAPPGSVIWVRPEQEGDLAAIVVADQGKGIPAEAHEHIFEKFARLDKNEPGGTGLGLYISRRLARAMGGDISVDSAPGQGARFVLTLTRDAGTMTP